MLGKLDSRTRAVEAGLSNSREVALTLIDVFWMPDDRVGVAGRLQDGTLVRLRVGANGPDSKWMLSAKGGYLAPFQEIRLQIGDAPPDTLPPFTEMRMAAETGHRIVGELPFGEILALLEASCVPGVREMFGAKIHVDPGGGKDWYVTSGTGDRSLGTIKVAEVLSVTTRRSHEEDLLDMRLAFRDASGEIYKLTIVDLLAQGHFAIRGKSYTPQLMARGMRTVLQGQNLVYLRIGLAEPTESQPDRCYLQIVGITIGQEASPAYRARWGGNGLFAPGE